MKTKSITLTGDQDKANNAFLDFLVSDENFFVIQGAAGTGKSFLIRHLLETFHAKYSAYCLFLQKEVKRFDIRVTATTNKAVTVIDDFLAGAPHLHDDPKTIYSLLGLRVANNTSTGKTSLTYTENPYNRNVFSPREGVLPLVFVDEASFINTELHEIIDTILRKDSNGKIVYIGDKYQLSPIDQAYSIMDSMKCSKVSLNEIVRNSGNILKVGTQFRKTVETGIFLPIPFNSSDVVHADGSEFKRLVEQSFGAPNWNPTKSKILAWTNERVQEYNQHIRTFLRRPKMFDIGEVVITNEFIKGSSFNRSVDSEVKITNIEPNLQTFYDVRGYMIELDHSHVGFMPERFQDAKNLLKKLAANKDWKKFFEVKETWLDLRAVYASSVHKSQGSTYETVFIDLADIGKNWNSTDVARLLYVSITRASKQVVCYGYLPDRYGK